jgi:transcriptional regulator with XRE-family HTH domain
MDRDGRYTLDGETINRLRRELGWSVRELARQAQTSHDTIIDLEHNRRRPRGALVRKVALALDVAPRELARETR